ncbi:serine/threonine-protein kinase [Polyangium sp. y55x31]|uniref:serine/threonine-protein kinase n=1 Tax=Polyangium sp. y55x31 TaxID=3042688 RepID=UPI0024822D6C|nr:serine/threonine-protein kinase [Polyangium sp. y55x31]MDI1479275.1 serine/threonine-protein kinase [Polyangium sp. y55x31]
MSAGVDAAATRTENEPLEEASFAEVRAEEKAPTELLSTAPADLPEPSEAADANVDETGRVLEGRYTLVRKIGGGAHGDVWAADDRILGERVALKWMRVAHGSMLARIRREITTLRMLRFPGVVRLIDDGVADGRPFLVMELVEGRPFPGADQPPGAPRRMAWQTLAGPALALLEALSHVHAAGVVHRDLKPENVLVRPDGRPVVLDFGISQLQAPGSERLTGAGQLVGTPLYVAPEQILGRSVDARTDLYAIGVMLYESLTCRVPHEAPDVPSMLRARLVKPAPHVQELAPDLPAVVARVIDRLLATRVEDRFGSAAEVLAALRGESMNASATLPWLGSQSTVHEVVDAVQAGRSVDIVGPRGSGRSRYMHEAADVLAARGRSVLWTRPSRAPLGSVLPFLGEPPGEAELRLEGALAWANDALSRALAERAVLFADDAEQLDPWSASILARHRKGPGVIVRALVSPPPGASPDEIVEVPPLDEAALAPLFAGPDKLFHLREDAARALWERTDGLPARIEAELLTWTRLGLARREGSLFAVDRDALSRLYAGLVVIPSATTTTHGLDDTLHAEETLRWLSLAGRPMTILQLAHVMQYAPWRIEAACDSLVTLGAARRRGHECFEGRGRVDLPWNEQQRIEAHRAIAAVLLPGDEGRLHHLLAAGLAREGAREAAVAARRYAVEGDLGAATAALAEGLRAAREQRTAQDELEILATWAKVAFAQYTPRALDRVLYELTRAHARGPVLDRLESLLRAALAAPGAGGLNALEMADDIEPFQDPELERRRHRIRITAVAARASASLLAEVLEEVETWAEESDHPLARLSLAEGRALQRYHEGRFQEAASLHAQAATLEPWKTGRISLTLNSASALLEAFRHAEAAERATEARALAAQCRDPYWEGRAEWLIRAAHYRMGKLPGPDFEFVDAVARVGALDLEALVCLNEAAAAMRAGMLGEGAALAKRAASVWHGMGRPFATMLARALAITCGEIPDAGEVEALAERAVACKGPGLGIQALGLLGRVFPAMRGQWQHAVEGLVRDIPRTHWDRWMDVLSVNESLEGTVERPGETS